MRCFVALGTDGSERQVLRAWLEAAGQYPELAVTPVENLHLTLEFLGEIDDSQVAAVGGGLEGGGGSVPRNSRCLA